MRKTLLVLLSAALCGAVALLVLSAAFAQGDTGSEQQQAAVQAKLGTIAAAEFAYFSMHGAYATLAELIEERMVAAPYGEEPQADGMPFEVAVSEDQQYFVILAHDIGGKAWRIDRTGEIKAAAAEDTAQALLDEEVAQEKEPPPGSETGAAPSEPDHPEGVASDMNTQPTAPVLVVFETTKGELDIEVHPEWSPLGAAHFLELVKAGYYDGAPWFRVVDRFVAQCGIAADPKLNEEWGEKTIKDEPVVRGNQPGFVAFGKTGEPNSRSTHIYINLVDNSERLDKQGFACFARVARGMDVAQKLCRCEYDDQWGLMQEGGLDKFKAQFPEGDYIVKAYVKQ
jgi:cyclophilin family peptidyl-prolyl cis-trans isomerase